MEERRQHARHQVEWPVRLWITDSCFLAGRALDASVHGTYVHLTWIPSGLLKLGVAYRLEMQPPSAGRVTCIASVRRISRNGVGLEITEELALEELDHDASRLAVAVVMNKATGADAEPETVTMGRILVVDDDPEIQAFVGEYFTGKGYKVTNASTADEALAAVRQERPHLVLLDVTIPGAEGLDVLRQIRQHDPGIGVIMITGNRDPALVQATLELGAVNYLIKPFDLERLDRVVRWNLRLSTGVDRETEIVIKQAAGVTVVAPDGDIDLSTAEQLERTLTDLVKQGGMSRLVMDLGAVTYVDSSGLAAVVGAMKQARSAGGDLKLCSVQDSVLSVLEMTGLAEHITVLREQHEAIAAFA